MATVQRAADKAHRPAGTAVVLYPAPTYSCTPPGESAAVRRAADAKASR